MLSRRVGGAPDVPFCTGRSVLRLEIMSARYVAVWYRKYVGYTGDQTSVLRSVRNRDRRLNAHLSADLSAGAWSLE